MPSNRKPNNNNQLTRRQASTINKHNRKISGNINSLMDEIYTMTYGSSRIDKVDSLNDDFNKLLKSEIDTMTKASDGDTTGFITRLFSDNNKKSANIARNLEDIFSTNEGQLESFLNDQYRNRLIKQSDLHEVASQLNELTEAINISRDAIVSPDIVDGHMSRTLTFDADSIAADKGDYISIVENMESKFDLQKKLKNFIIPKSLGFGEYYVYVIPYSKIFEDFSREKRDNKYNMDSMYGAYHESVNSEFTLSEFLNKDEDRRKDIDKYIFEYVKNGEPYKRERFNGNGNINANKEVVSEFSEYLNNISINNSSLPICIMEEGVDSAREYYTEFVEKTVIEDEKGSKTFNRVMTGIEGGIHSFSNKSTKNENFSNIRDCYVKLIDPMHLLPIEIMSETIGYYYIQDNDINPVSGILTSTIYYDKYTNQEQNSVIDVIAETIVSAFDKKFLEKNIKFKKLIVEALNYYRLNNKRLKFQFIPKEYIVPFKVNVDEEGHGTSIIEPSLFYAKLYLMLLLFKMMAIVLNSNDTKVNYIKSSGIEKNVVNKIEEIARKKQQRQITLSDMFSYTTLINKIGAGSEMYIPVGRSDTRGIETEILSGQDVQLNTDFMEMLKKGYISGTGVPDVLMNYINEADFAKTLELANNRFQGRVVSYQLDLNRDITILYKTILKYSTSIPENVIDSFTFNFIQPKYSNANITNDMINNHNTLMEFLVQLMYGQNAVDDEEKRPKIERFKRLVTEERMPMLNLAKIEELYKKANVEGTADILNPDNNNSSDNDGE